VAIVITRPGIQKNWLRHWKYTHLSFDSIMMDHLPQHKDAPNEGECRAAALPQTPQRWNLKNTEFLDIMISEVRDFPVSRDQPLKSADD
jgi:hypothetical protein